MRVISYQPVVNFTFILHIVVNSLEAFIVVLLSNKFKYGHYLTFMVTVVSQ